MDRGEALVYGIVLAVMIGIITGATSFLFCWLLWGMGK